MVNWQVAIAASQTGWSLGQQVSGQVR